MAPQVFLNLGIGISEIQKFSTFSFQRTCFQPTGSEGELLGCFSNFSDQFHQGFQFSSFFKGQNCYKFQSQRQLGL